MKDFRVKQNISGREPSGGLLEPRPAEEQLRRQNEELRQQVAHLQEINQSLTDSEQRLRLAIATGQIGLWVWNSTDVTNAGDWSPRLKEIFGLPLDTEVTHEIFLNGVHPEDRARVNAGVMEALGGAQGGEYRCEYRIVHAADGALRWVTARGQAFFDAQGTPVRFIGTLMDITERKLGEQSIARTNAELEQRVAERTEELARSNHALRASEQLARGQLDALANMLEVLAGESDPDQLPRHVVTTIQAQLGAFSVTIWERNQDRLDLLGVTEEGRFLTRSEAGYFEGSIPVTGQAPPLWVEALRSGSHILIEDIDKEPTRVLLGDGRTAIWRQGDLTRPFASLKAHLFAQGVRALLICPLVLARQLAGIIGIRFKGARVFGRDEIELTKALAHQAMLSIQLMRLSQQSRRAAVVAERNRLAREIHDTLAQGFTGVIVQLEAAEDAEGRGLTAERTRHVARAGQLARESLQEARRSVRALRPQILEQNELPGAIEALFEKTTAGTGLQAALTVNGTPRRLACDAAENLLRIVQEALANVLRHASARRFTARLSYESETVHLELRDDGSGFDPAAHHEGFGLLGMKERVEAMGGRIGIESAPGTGTAISIAIPSPERATSGSAP
ncbi:MAG: PAS domain-containing protein [Chthoniobacter sp.]